MFCCSNSKEFYVVQTTKISLLFEQQRMFCCSNNKHFFVVRTTQTFPLFEQHIFFRKIKIANSCFSKLWRTKTSKFEFSIKNHPICSNFQPSTTLGAETKTWVKIFELLFGPKSTCTNPKKIEKNNGNVIKKPAMWSCVRLCGGTFGFSKNIKSPRFGPFHNQNDQRKILRLSFFLKRHFFFADFWIFDFF